MFYIDGVIIGWYWIRGGGYPHRAESTSTGEEANIFGDIHRFMIIIMESLLYVGCVDTRLG